MSTEVQRLLDKIAAENLVLLEAKPREPNSAEPPEQHAAGFSVEAINAEHALVLMGSKAMVLKELSVSPIDDRQRMLTIQSFEAWYSNRFTEIRAPTTGTVKSVTWAKAWLTSPKRRQYAGVEFFPDCYSAPGTPGYLNLWKGFAFAPAPKPNGWKTLRDHLLINVCGGDEEQFDWVFGFFAHLVQRPRERLGVALVLRGGMGTGKTIIGHCFGALFPQHYFLVDDPRYVTGQFNAHMASCLLLQADEAVWAGDKAAEGRLEGLVTSPFQQIESKGVDPIRLKNYVRLIMTSNESWVVPAGRDERRFAVFDVAPRCAGNHTYFADIDAELRDGGYEALLHDLLAFDLERVNLRIIPKTSALLDQKERSLDPLKAWWLDRLVAGHTTRGREAVSEAEELRAWERVVPTTAVFDDYTAMTERLGVRRRASETDFGKELRKLAPGIKRMRPTIGGLRTYVYKFPPLAVCRDDWDAEMGQTRDWPPKEEDQPF